MSLIFWGLALPCLIVTTLWRWNDGLNQTREACDQTITEATHELQARLMSLRERVSEENAVSLEPRILSRVSFRLNPDGWKITDATFNAKTLERLELNERAILRMGQLPPPAYLDNRFWFERRQHGTYDIAHFGWKLAKSEAEEVTYVSMIADDWPFEKETPSCQVHLSKSPVPSVLQAKPWTDWIRTSLSRQTLPGLFYHATFLTHAANAQAQAWAVSGLALVSLLWVLIIAMQARVWRFEIHKSQAFQQTLQKFQEGDFKARPRLFLTDIDASIEHGLDQLANRMPAIAWHLHQGRHLNLSVKDIEDLSSGHDLERRMTLATVYFDSVPQEQTLRKIESAVLEHGGTTLSCQSRQMTLAWDCHQPALAMNPAYAVMAVIQARNDLMKLKFVVVFDLVDTQIMGSVAQQLILRDSSNSQNPMDVQPQLFNPEIKSTEILVTEDLAHQIDPYFVLSPTSKKTTRGQKLMTVEGYVDTAENPVLLASSKP